MSVFRNLRDVCVNFEEDLQNDSPQLYCARIGQSFDDEITNKMRELSLFSAKLRLLQAKSISIPGISALLQAPSSRSIIVSSEKSRELENIHIHVGPDRPEPCSEEDTMARYEDAAMWKVLEQKTVKSVSQFHDVRQLITTPDSKLHPELVDRKEEIISKLKDYRLKEEQLRETEAMLTKAEEEHNLLRTQWHEELGALRDLREQANAEEEALEGPLHDKLKSLIQKMEMMRWLISRLVTARSRYDWLADPDRRLAALKMARETNTIDSYTGM